jgi:sterol desaturase/sphingolipid hydroxylase (fatty acid hydroxylase superfamily)
MKSAEEAPGQRPSKIVVFSVPAVIAVLFVAFSTPQPRSLSVGIMLAAFMYFFSHVFLLAIWHGFQFLRSLFRSRRGDSQR